MPPCAKEGSPLAEAPQGGIRLEGAPNFRDLGGHPGAGGRPVRPGLVYRSESLAGLSDRDVETIGGLGIGLVIDLRSANEKRAQPNRWPRGGAAETLSIDIDADLRAGNDALLGILKSSPTRAGARQMLQATYRLMPQSFGPHLAGLFDRLAAGDCPPAVVHCTVGKDRTGFVAAMLLFALGASRQTVYGDYLASADYADPGRMGATVAEVMHGRLGIPVDGDVVATLLGVHGDYLDAALAGIEAEHGSVDGYLQRVGGLTGEKRERLQARLLE